MRNNNKILIRNYFEKEVYANKNFSIIIFDKRLV